MKKILLPTILALSLSQLSCVSGEEPAFGAGEEIEPSDTGVVYRQNFTLLFSNFALTAFDPDDYSFKESSTDINIFIADRAGAPIEGRTVNIRADWGIASPSCTTDSSGKCTVTWTTADPNDSFPNYLSDTYCVRIVAYTTGEEAFHDENGNGVLDTTDEVSALGNAGNFTNGFFDMSEPFFDRDNDNTFTAGYDGPINTNPAGIAGFDAGDGEFNGTNCTSSFCSANTTTVIWNESYIDLKDETNADPAAASNTCAP